MLRPPHRSPRAHRREAGHDEQGAAVADFAMVSGLLMLVFLGVLQLGFALHVRNTLISCASEGARLGARLGSSPEAGAERTRELIVATLPDHFARDVDAAVSQSDGVAVVRVQVRAPLPVLGPFGPARSLEVDGRAFLESQ